MSDWGVIRRRQERVNVSVDILLLILVSTGLFGLTPFESFMDGNGAYGWYMLALAVVYIRNVGFEIRMGVLPKLKPMLWILLGALVSFVPAYLYYGQHLYHSVVVYRQFLGYLVYPILLSIRPTNVELKRALYVFAAIYFFMVLWVTFMSPDWVPVPENTDFMEEDDLVHRLPGDQFLVPALIFALNDLRYRKNKIRWGSMAGLIFLDIFLIQSRTLLMSSVIVIMMAAVLDKNASRRLVTETLMGIFIVAFFVLANGYIMGLIRETTEQLSNTDYNRVKAFYYFISGENGLASYFWGNGFISGHAHPIMENLMKEGIYNSDLGLIGFWHQFGIIPVITILVFCFRGLSRMHSLIVRANAANILVGTLSIAYFFNIQYSLWLCLFFYLFYTDDEYLQAKKDKEEKDVKRAVRRYRSLV